MQNPSELVGRLVKIADKIGVIASCSYVDDGDVWAVSVVLHDGETFVSYASLIQQHWRINANNIQTNSNSRSRCP
jgi:hypothetical protein